jgi:nucleoid DNA-binding protein
MGAKLRVTTAMLNRAGGNSMPVGRQELIKRVATKSNKSIKESTAFVNATLDTIKEALEQGDSVRLVGFGVFSVRDTAESQRVNPQTREKITVPARKRVKFTPGKELNEAVAQAGGQGAAHGAKATAGAQAGGAGKR